MHIYLLKVRYTYLTALEISDQAATAFIALMKSNQSVQNHNPVNKQPNRHNNESTPSFTPKAAFTCNNCGKIGHSVA